MDNRGPVFQKAGEPPEVAAAAVTEVTRESRSFDDRVRAESERIRSQERAAAENRNAAGLGFWRLVWIVTLGVLLAQAISWLALSMIGAVSRGALLPSGTQGQLDGDGDGIPDAIDPTP